MTVPLLAVEHLTTVFDLETGTVPAVNDVSFEVRSGETLGLVGESGSGKSVTALSILRLVQAPGRIAGGCVRFKGQNLLDLTESDMRAVRGAGISMIFQEPMTALDPVYRVGDQIAETLRVHGLASGKEAGRRAVELLESVRVADAAHRARDYPHQLSGGMRQRVLIAAALACRPSLVIADEPTTALDVTIQAQILSLLADLRRSMNLALLLVTHDLGVIAEAADRVAVMYAGRIVEQGPTREVFRAPQHPYTRGLLRSMPGSRDQRAGGRLAAIDGAVPMLGHLPSGCAFHPRCPEAFEPCATAPPSERTVGPDHVAACYLHDAPMRTSGHDDTPASRPRPL